MKCDELKVHKAYNRWIDEEMPTPNDDLICNEVYLKDEVDDAIAELKQKLQDQCISCPVKMQEDDVVAELNEKLENAKATAYTESVDAGMRERRLKRALYKACANWAHHRVFVRYKTNEKAWENVERKCRAKAKEYL